MEYKHNFYINTKIQSCITCIYITSSGDNHQPNNVKLLTQGSVCVCSQPISISLAGRVHTINPVTDSMKYGTATKLKYRHEITKNVWYWFDFFIIIINRIAYENAFGNVICQIFLISFWPLFSVLTIMTYEQLTQQYPPYTTVLYHMACSDIHIIIWRRWKWTDIFFLIIPDIIQSSTYLWLSTRLW